MGSYWSLRLSSYDHRAAVVVSSVACFNPNNTIFTQSSPRFKQMFMYMAGYDDEERFDEEVAKGMTVRGHLGKIKCPTLLVTGDINPHKKERFLTLKKMVMVHGVIVNGILQSIRGRHIFNEIVKAF